MGIGFALGGIAKGITDQQELAQKGKALDLQTAELKSNTAYRNAMLGLESKRLDATTGIETANKARELYNGLLDSAQKIISKGFEQGKDVNWAADLLNKMGPQISSMGQAAGIDPNATMAQVKGILTSGITPETKVGQAWEKVQQKIADGTPLTPGEEQLKQIKLTEMKALMSGGGGTAGAGDLPTDNMSPPTAPAAPAAPAPMPAAPAPAAASSPMAPAVAAPAAATAAPHPPVPPSLIGKAIAWSGQTQRFYDKAGNAYNQQGVPVPQ